MAKIFPAALVAILVFVVPANARGGGGGGAEPMPLTNFADLPEYRPAQSLERSPAARKRTRAHQTSTQAR